MAHSSYSASERRGILAIVVIALLLIGGGITLSLCGRNKDIVEEIPVVVTYPEMIDSAKVTTLKEKGSGKDKYIKQSSSKEKKEKTYRRRSPLDEPV